ncbi:putative phage abortive infection protein [Thiothrix winogradskyi]|uniref:Phage abortive infection protein n=1 Tax=Thiothrix winogradskyi TaxID=96472 RepID=A0ABY3STM1_9GAMM|nr:putative phage abortive infection protein [Thiothrix winogradskyi]UJS22548.1 putative phage abortive infection protein [Thiothrix winogradskyi]
MNSEEQENNQSLLIFEQWLKDHWLIFFMMGLLIIAIVVVGTVAFFYFQQQSSIFPINNNRADWGVTGDFFGGILNPVFAFLGLIMLLATLYQSQRELALTREELTRSTEALKDQALTQQQQRFENTFFSLLAHHNTLLDVVRRSNYEFDWSAVNSPECARKKLWDDVHEKNYEVKVYFRFIYQILKFIDASGIEDKKTYSSLVRSFIDSYVGELILINALCFDDHDNCKKFKLLIENYAFLEHVQIDTQEEKMCTTPDYLKSAHDYDEIQGKRRSDPNRENLRNQIQNRFSFYSEITKDDRGGRYYSKDAYGDRHYYDRVRGLVKKGLILVRPN